MSHWRSYDSAMTDRWTKGVTSRRWSRNSGMVRSRAGCSPESADEFLELPLRPLSLAAVFLNRSLQALELFESRTVVERNSGTLLSHGV